jgi:hypothetical protein
MQVRREEPARKAEELRRLGPEVQSGEVVASVDEIVVRRPEKRSFLELGTACVRTTSGYRYLSGNISMVLRQLLLLLTLCGGIHAKIVLLGDGARWIIRFFERYLADWPSATLIWDWYHCYKKCYDLTSLICRGRKAKQELLRLLLKYLWCGQVQSALNILEEYRSQTKNVEKLDELIKYLDARRAYIPNYQEHRLQRHYIGNAHVEKGKVGRNSIQIPTARGSGEKFRAHGSGGGFSVWPSDIQCKSFSRGSEYAFQNLQALY